MKRDRPEAKARRAAMAQHPSNGSREWTKGYDDRMGTRCATVTIRDPEDPRWDPDLPDTYVKAECCQSQTHKGWHVARDGYAWDPDDDANHVQFPAPAA